jgi:hypothetical protein
MSILTAAYQLCKSVKKAPARDDIANLILGLNLNERGTFGLYAREQYAQLVGYLLVDQERSAIETKRGRSVPPLADDERQLLTDVHRQIVELNRRCIAPLLESLPNCARAVDPYGELKYAGRAVSSGREILGTEVGNEIVAGFHQHPAMVAALETTEFLAHELSEDSYRSEVRILHHILMEGGPLKSRRQPRRYLRLILAKSVKGYIRHIGALVCVRDSLANLNQLLFQALLMDKLVIFDEDNTIDIGVQIAHSGGFGVGLVIQQVRGTILEDFMTDNGALVLLKGTMLKEPSNILCRIEKLFEQSSRDTGTVKQCELRLIDENMNSFAPLLKVRVP